MQIVVMLRAAEAPAPRGASARGAGESVAELVQRLGFHLEPMHPGARDAALRSSYTVEVADAAAAQQVAHALQQHPAVEAAYVKPPDAAP